MSTISVEVVEKNFDSILELVGNDPFINWETFSHNSSDFATSIDQLNKSMAIVRDIHHRQFIQTMKKLKSLDLPDLVNAVKGKKLPKQALRSVLTRFKMGEGEKIQLTETKESLKENASKVFEEYLNENNTFLEEIKKFNTFMKDKIKDSGYVPEKVPDFSIKATVKFELDESLASQLAGDIKIQHIPGTSMIGLNTYKHIVDNSYNLIKKEYEKITKDSRIKQREVLDKPEEYLKAMNEYLTNSEALIIEGQTLLAKKLGLPDKKLEESEIHMMERGLGQHMLMLQSQMRGKIKESIPAGQDVDFNIAKQVIDYQTRMIGQKVEEIKKIFQTLQKTQQTIQTIPMLLALILNDLVFVKYGFEEEDFMKNVNEEVISTNPELVKIFKDMEIAIIKLMQNLSVITPEIGKIMEQSANQRDKVPPQTNVSMMPSNNPMDMLQQQQVQQMQQMYSQMQQKPK